MNKEEPWGKLCKLYPKFPTGMLQGSKNSPSAVYQIFDTFAVLLSRAL
jgi:hypothetical protein